MGVDQPLFDLSPGDFGSGAMEAAVLASINQQKDRIENDPTAYARSQLAIALARNIDAGNRKGRAIGNEAAQLDQVLDKLAGVDVDEGGLDGLPAEVRQLFDAFEALPRIGPAEVRDTA